MVLSLKLTLILDLKNYKSITDSDLTAALNAKINEKFVASLQE